MQVFFIGVDFLEVDIVNIKYTVKALLNTGDILDLTGLCTSFSWGDDKGGIAQKADITLANTKIEQGYISDMICLCTKIYIYANDAEAFRGIVWEWDYTSATEKELSLTAYDNMIYMTQSKSDSYFSSGMSTQSIVESICREWNIPLSYTWESWEHGKVPLQGKTISNQITEVLDEAQTKLNSKYVAVMVKDTLEIRKKGSNQDIFVFHANNIMSTKNSFSLSNLVTKVLIVGKSEEEKRRPILETIDGKLEYGVLQEIVTKDTNKTLEDVRKEAENILKEKGEPEESIEVSAPDVPQIRKGDKIKVVAGNLSSYFFVEGISHNATDKTMDIELSREE